MTSREALKRIEKDLEVLEILKREVFGKLSVFKIDYEDSFISDTYEFTDKEVDKLKDWLER